MADATVVPEDGKLALRRAMRVVRRGVADQAARSAVIVERLRSIEAVRSASVVVAFSAVPGEPDLAAFVDWCDGRGMQVVCPDAAPTAAYPIDPALVDVVVVPGVAFTSVGDRLGQGGGWYDRFLSEVRSTCVTVGVCFAPQIVDAIPTEPHDVRVDLVITDDGAGLPSADG